MKTRYEKCQQAVYFDLNLPWMQKGLLLPPCTYFFWFTYFNLSLINTRQTLLHIFFVKTNIFPQNYENCFFDKLKKAPDASVIDVFFSLHYMAATKNVYNQYKQKSVYLDLNSISYRWKFLSFNGNVFIYSKAFN